MALTFSRQGQADGAGSDIALFLQMFAGEVLSAFNTKNIMLANTRVKHVDAGKSHSFPATGKTTADFLAIGTPAEGQTINHNEVIVNVDKPVVTSVLISDWDELLNHWSSSSEYTHQMGEALANKIDTNILIAAVLSARGSANVSGGDGGTVITLGAGLTSASASGVSTAVKSALFTARQNLDEKNVPGRAKCYVLPDLFYVLAQDTNLYNRDFNGQGSIAEGVIQALAGIDITMTNNLPSTNIASNPAEAANTYSGDFSKTAGICMLPDAVATVMRKGISMETKRKADYLANLVIGSYVAGTAPLRPEAAVEIKYAAV